MPVHGTHIQPATEFSPTPPMYDTSASDGVEPGGAATGMPVMSLEQDYDERRVADDFRIAQALGLPVSTRPHES